MQTIFYVWSFTDEALIAETTVWPNFFLMNAFFALIGSKLFIIIVFKEIKKVFLEKSCLKKIENHLSGQELFKESERHLFGQELFLED